MSTTPLSTQARDPRPQHPAAPARASRCDGDCRFCTEAVAPAAPCRCAECRAHDELAAMLRAARGDDAPVLARAAALRDAQRSRFAAHVANDFAAPSSGVAHAATIVPDRDTGEVRS